MRLDLEPGTEPYLNFAKQKHAQLARQRAVAGLPVLKKQWVVPPVFIELKSEDFDDWIRITGSRPLRYLWFANPGLTVSITEENDGFQQVFLDFIGINGQIPINPRIEVRLPDGTILKSIPQTIIGPGYVSIFIAGPVVVSYLSPRIAPGAALAAGSAVRVEYASTSTTNTSSNPIVMSPGVTTYVLYDTPGEVPFTVPYESEAIIPSLQSLVVSTHPTVESENEEEEILADKEEITAFRLEYVYDGGAGSILPENASVSKVSIVSAIKYTYKKSTGLLVLVEPKELHGVVDFGTTTYYGNYIFLSEKPLEQLEDLYSAQVKSLEKVNPKTAPLTADRLLVAARKALK